jgi:hypothetical protein
MLKASAERIGEEGQSMVPEFLQAWIQLVKVPAQLFEENGRDCLVRVKWLSPSLHRAYNEKILVKTY